MAWDVTQNLGLTMDEETEKYSVLRVNQNTQTIDDFAGEMLRRLGGTRENSGMSIKAMSRAEYTALLGKDANTAYFVRDSETFTIYLGTVPLAGGGGEPARAPAVQLAWATPAVRASQLRQLSFEPSGAWKCDPEWYYEGTQTATIGGRGYAKTNAKPAIGFVSQVNVGGIYSTLMLISDDPDAVNNSAAGAANISVQYGGITWYATNYNYSQGVQSDDTTGHFQTWPEILAFDSATGTISQQAILDVLAAVHATKNEEG